MCKPKALYASALARRVVKAQELGLNPGWPVVRHRTTRELLAAVVAREELLVRARVAEILVRILEKIRHSLTDRHVAKLAADITRVFAAVASAVFVESFAATWFSAHAVLALGANSS